MSLPWSTLKNLFVQEQKPAPEPVSLPEEDLVDEEEEVPLAPPLVGVSGVPEIVEGQEFSLLYLQHGVPVSAYTAEKLLSVIEGLAQMSPEQIRMVVAAMDAADTAWVITDPVEDARNKVRALLAQKGRVVATVLEIEQQAKLASQKQDEDLAAASADIKAQIEALQLQLHECISQNAKSKADIEAHCRAAKEAGARESARLDVETGRLNRIPNTFGGSL